MPSEAARSVRELQMLETMVDCAHTLGVAFSEVAEAETDTKRRLELFDAFQKSFLAVRMGIRLSMTLRAAPKAAPAPPSERTEAEEREAAERDPPERESSDRAERERERDRDYEPVSLPKFLATLGVVARDAGRLGDSLPAEAAGALPPLQRLLAQATADAPAANPVGGVATLTPPSQARTRRTLLASASTPLPGPRRPPPWSGSG